MPHWIAPIAECRVLVAALGEVDRWWRSEALDPVGIRYLARLYPRTAHLAAVETASLAARIEHDQRISMSRHFHLFRLPVADEALIRAWLESSDGAARLESIATQTRDERLNALHALVGTERTVITMGPISVGSLQSLRLGRATERIATAYASAFAQRGRVYPYLEDAAA